jgi:hypothetical protein
VDLSFTAREGVHPDHLFRVCRFQAADRHTIEGTMATTTGPARARFQALGLHVIDGARRRSTAGPEARSVVPARKVRVHQPTKPV